MTSCFIHLFPSWLALTLRWCPLDPWRGGTPSAEPECSEGINLGDMGLALFLYLLWQLLYYIKTEYQDRVSRGTRFSLCRRLMLLLGRVVTVIEEI